MSFSATTAVVLAFAPASRADMTKAQCIDANTKGQDLRRDGNLSAAREQFRACATPSCPAMVRSDCTKRLDEVEGAQPTIVFDAKDGAGHDLSAVAVKVDGRPLADRLDGTALRVDPGEHVFVFTVADEAPVTQTFVLKEGDKERRERIVIGPVVAASAAPPLEGTAPSTAPAAREASRGGGQKVLGVVIAGVGLAGIGVGSAFGLMTLSEVDKQKNDCPSAAVCARGSAESDHSSATTDRTISMVGFIAGGALLITGAVLFLTGGHSSETPVTDGLRIVPTVGPSGASLAVRGAFWR